jgi:predicted AAA+ superfamily ATPase
MFLVIIIAENVLFLVNMLTRTLETVIRSRFNQGKAILLIGPRQVGKTTLIKHCLDDRDFLFLNGDDPQTRKLFEGAGVSRLKSVIGKKRWIFIDEAQRISEVGLIAKMIIDEFSEVQLLISGSSALEIHQKTAEPLTGRKFEYLLFPISWEEFEKHVGFVESEARLGERLIYGMYPDVINHPNDARETLQQLASSYLYKDILALSGIRKPEILEKLLRALALQLGNEVSYNELARFLEIDKATVAAYIDLLEKAFIVFRLNSFSRNQRNEIRNNRKVYFYDNGVRNMLINNFNELDSRNDLGALWENFLVSERVKQQQYHRIFTNNYFWRNLQKQEIDFIEEREGRIFAFEFKWNPRKGKRIPNAFIQEYQSSFEVISRDNFRNFVIYQEADPAFSSDK